MGELTLAYKVRSYSTGTLGSAIWNARHHYFVADNSGGVAVGAGVGAAFGLGQLRGTYATSSKLEKATGMPVIGSIGEVVTGMQADQRAKRLKLFVGGTAALAAAYVLLLGVEVLQRGMAA